MYATVPRHGRRSFPVSGVVAVRAFTLVELLVTIAIIATLLALLIPALRHTVGAARGFRCQVSLRSVAFDFSVFADDNLHGDRGNDTREVGAHRFRLETFQESQYGLDEFWRWGSAQSYSLPDAAKNDPMRCSEMKGPITLLASTPCSTGIEPPRNISYGFNLRLHRAETVGPDGQLRLSSVVLKSAILDNPRVPLVWDVDGAIAESRGATPSFSAPSAGSNGFFANDAYWFPGRRHNGATNYALMDGSVSATSKHPSETNWDWSFQSP